MESIDQKEVVGTARLTRNFILFALTLLVLAAFGPLVMMFQYSRIPEEIELPALGKLILPIFGAFAMGVLASLTLVRRVVLPVIHKIKNQFLTLGYVEDNQCSLFSNFGFNLFLGVIIGFSTIGDYLCQELSLEDATISLSHLSWNLLRCQVWDYSIGAFIAGIGIVGFLWMFFQVRLLNSTYKCNSHSWLRGRAAVASWLDLTDQSKRSTHERLHTANPGTTVSNPGPDENRAEPNPDGHGTGCA